MRLPAVLYCVVFFLTIVHPCFSQKPAIGAEPAWVTKRSIDFSNLKFANDISDGYLNLAYEKQINVVNRSTYIRRAVKIVTAAGVQNESEVSVSYDPAYEHVVFHHIQVFRGTQVVNKLNLSSMKIVHEEKELSRSIYNGTLTALFFLEDIRKGDIIQYDYTIYGTNPVFNGNFFSTFDLQFSEPINSLFYKIVCPASRTLNIINRFSDIKPAITADGNNKTYIWSATNVAPLKAQDDIPGWYDPYPDIMVSEYKDWQEVNNWALTLFPFNRPVSAGLRRKIEEIAHQNTTDETKVLAALHFVQDEIRYLGIEIGVNSHRPNSPSQVFSQLFGDCKDKAFLLVTMLKQLGIDASPVLINTRSQNAIRDWVPSPGDFNHATVRLKLNGKTYWVDPTIAYQRGGIENISFPNYKCGLVLTDTTTALSTIPLQDQGQVTAKELFTIKDIYGPAQLDVTTKYTGSFADDIRADVDNSSMSELEKSYLEFYSNYYKGAKKRDSLRIDDSATDGSIVTHEYYTVDKLWWMEEGNWKAEFDPLLIKSILDKVNDGDRQMPLALNYPSDYTEEIEVRLPEAWNFNPSEAEVNSGSFRFKSVSNAGEKTVRLKYHYQALQDYVDTKNAAAFFSDYHKMKEHMGYEVYKTIDASASKKEYSPKSGNVLGLILLVVIIAALFIAWSRR